MHRSRSSPVSNSGTTSRTKLAAAPRATAGQLVDRSDVVGGPGERHHVPAARVDAEPLLDLGHDPKVASTSSVGSDRLAAGPDLRQRLRMHAAVLAHLELGQVEAERLHLPDQVLQLAVCLPQRAGRRQAALERPAGRRSRSAAEP